MCTCIVIIILLVPVLALTPTFYMIAELYTGARATMMSTMYHPQFVAMATALQTDHALLAAAVRFTSA